MRKLASGIALFYMMTLVMQCATLCFADTPALEGTIIGTGPLKIWMNIGTDKGVETDMIFSVKRGGEIIAKVHVKKAGKSSSEAEITQLKEGVTCQAGDSVTFLSKAVPEEKPEPVKGDTKTQEIKSEVKTEEPKKEEAKPAEATTSSVTATTTPAPAAETAPKTDEKKPKVKKGKKKKFGSGLFKISSTKFLLIAVLGVAALAIGGGGGKSSGGGNGAGDPNQSSQTAPPVPADDTF